MACAHDCGLVINPETLHHTVECGMLHGLSRALWEEADVATVKLHGATSATAPRGAR